MKTPLSRISSRPRLSSSTNLQSSELPDTAPPSSGTPVPESTPKADLQSQHTALPATEIRQRSERHRKYYNDDDAAPSKAPISDVMPVRPNKKKNKPTGALSIFGASITTGARTQANYRRRLNPSLVRRIRTFQIMHYVSHIIAFITILFFTFGWLLHYHVVPGIEARLTPEARILVNDLLNRHAFEECNFTGWLDTPVANLTYDTERCSKHLGLSPAIVIHYEAEDTVKCFPRIEIHPCASPDVYGNESIAWDVVHSDYTKQICPGTHDHHFAYIGKRKTTSFLKQDDLAEANGTIIPGVAFYFSCPHCVISTGIIKMWKNRCYHGVTQLSPSVPLTAFLCNEVVKVPCSIQESSLMDRVHEYSISADVFPTYILPDVNPVTKKKNINVKTLVE
uniref:Brr6_like_C_C domain-containing protein n=1 Tax=Panagrellus redivivus TaxID=6233 RepID=A0A7E5A0H9_PANRE